ncbi:ABC transporter ATP-binding protein/permease [Roseovarius salinarum]|uniref:ABC transporter ATP-binding protein/permease n=1 Tax=Roseovarius salinarum TaxID=1981892 RepID=UPI001E314CF4|nr:ATP-binding cassette domain-containing protein [Roseovarius salinarum]
MTQGETGDPAKQRLGAMEARAATATRRAAALAVLARALWAGQALAVAWAVHGWVQPEPVPGFGAAALFLGVGLLRAVLDHLGAGVAFRAADRLVAEERAALLAREARRADAPAASASVAALAAQKLPMLVPYLTRYRVAFAQVAVIPGLFLVLTLSVSWIAGLVLLVAGPLIPLFMALVGFAAREASTRQMVEIGDMNTLLMDRLAALTDIRLLNATERSVSDFEARAEGLRQRTMAVLRVAFLSSTVLELFAALGVAMVAVYTGFSLLGEITVGAWATPLTLGGGVFILLLAPEFFQPLRDLAAAWHDRAAALSVAGELAELEAGASATCLGTGGPAAPLDGPATVVMQGVRVRQGDRVLHLPDIAVEPGDAVALAGQSGSGKSTALAAIAGLRPVDSGRVEVAGRTLDDATADAWRARLTWVPQTVHFPDETLRAFLDVRRTGGDPSGALRAARADHVVARLPEGLETRLGETGAGVSGGEARRLLLARAIMARADVVLADEPTADLDPATASDIAAVLRRLADDGVTVIVATHDTDLAGAMDRVIRMEGAE